MATKTATITIDADIAEAWNAAPAAIRKQLHARLKKELGIGVKAEKEAPRLSKKESELFLKINAYLPDEQQDRFDELTDKRKQNLLTKAERVELLQLAEASEQIWVERIRAISELAKLRRTTPDELMDSLGIPRRSYE